jgi:hypothetical protein
MVSSGPLLPPPFLLSSSIPPLGVSGRARRHRCSGCLITTRVCVLLPAMRAIVAGLDGIGGVFTGAASSQNQAPTSDESPMLRPIRQLSVY